MRCDGRDNRKKLCDFVFIVGGGGGEGGEGGAVEERGGGGQNRYALTEICKKFEVEI